MVVDVIENLAFQIRTPILIAARLTLQCRSNVSVSTSITLVSPSRFTPDLGTTVGGVRSVHEIGSWTSIHGDEGHLPTTKRTFRSASCPCVIATDAGMKEAADFAETAGSSQSA